MLGRVGNGGSVLNLYNILYIIYIIILSIITSLFLVFFVALVISSELFFRNKFPNISFSPNWFKLFRNNFAKGIDIYSKSDILRLHRREEDMKPLTITITEKDLTSSRSATYPELISVFGSAIQALIEQIKTTIPDEQKEKVVGEMYDITNRVMGQVLEASFPEVLKASDIDSEVLLEAENRVLKEMAQDTDKIVPLRVLN